MLTEERHRNIYAIVLLGLLLSRFASMVVAVKVEGANPAWSLFAVACLGGLAWPLLVMRTRRESNIFLDYFPIFLYLLYLPLRINLGFQQSLKCVLTEFIVWFSFIFTIEVCSRDPRASALLQKCVVWFAKAMVLVGIAQFAAFLARVGTLNANILNVEARPVHGVFSHENVFLILILPFAFYFFKRRAYVWVALTLFACLGTGARSPVFAACCLFILIGCSVFRIRITWAHLGATFGVIALAYTILISMNSGGFDWRMEESRGNTSTLRWRVDHWRNYLQDTDGTSVLVGHGLGSSYNVVKGRDDKFYLPHNDYVRIYYERGLVGLAMTVLLFLFVCFLMMRSLSVENDFILITFLIIGCFMITDNFIYSAEVVWIYMFMASFITRPSAPVAALTVVAPPPSPLTPARSAAQARARQEQGGSQ